MTKNIHFLILTIIFGLLINGCTSPQKKSSRTWNVSIVKKTSASIEVDLIGVSDIEKPIWEGYSVDKYWSDEDSRRANADKITNILPPVGQEWKISSKDPQWKKWESRGATYLLLIARLPGKFDTGATDPRRLCVSLRPVWKGRTLKFEVYDTEIRPLMAPIQ